MLNMFPGSLIHNFLYFVAFASLASSRLAADVYNLSSIAVYQCIKDSGYQHMYIQVQNRTHAFIPTSIQSLYNAKNIGITPDIQLMVCRNRTINETVNSVMNSIPRDLYKNIWVEINTNINQANCTWFWLNKTDNCQFLKDIMAEFKKHNEKPGVHVDSRFYSGTFNGTTSCPLSQMVPLGYTREDGQPSFDGFEPIGMWTTPTRKRYKSKQPVCGLNLGLNYEH